LVVATLKNLNYGKTSTPSGVDDGVGGDEVGVDNGVENNVGKILRALSFAFRASFVWIRLANPNSRFSVSPDARTYSRLHRNDG
jgi:hypothetical protein